MEPTILISGFALILIAITAWLFINCYKKSGPNEALIVSGTGNRPTIIVGGGTMVLPLIQRADRLSLEVLTIEVSSNTNILTESGVPILVDGVAQVRVDSREECIRTAAELFLGKSKNEIREIAQETLLGHLRAIVGTMTVEELISNFDSFSSRVRETTTKDLTSMGLTAVSFNIKNVKDNVGYLEALGRKRTAEAKKDAAVGEANATKETLIAKANATRESLVAQANATESGAVAQFAADTRVEEAKKDYEVKQAIYEAEISVEKAISDTQYDINQAKATQSLILERQQIKIVEAQKEVELQSVKVQKAKLQLESEITKPAEVEKRRITIQAESEKERVIMLAQGDAQATMAKAAGEAEARSLNARAEAEAMKELEQARAEALRAKGISEAEVMAATGRAEAEALLRKAAAFKHYNQAAIASMIIEKLPLLVEAAAQPLSCIEDITILSTDDNQASASYGSGFLAAATQGLATLKALSQNDSQSRETGSGLADEAIKAEFLTN